MRRTLMDRLLGKKNSRLDRELQATTTELDDAKQRNRAAVLATESALSEFLRANEALQLSITSYKLGRRH